jgi:sugar/nucleoside kinase (ribokinase family)
VVIHAVEGSVAVGKDGSSLFQGSVRLPDGFSKGATGAGDAFAAGLIHGIHEEAPLAECLQMAVCAAAACLQDPSTSEGMQSLEKCLELGAKFGFRDMAQE